MRRALYVLLILNGLLLPVGCIPTLFLLNAVNPMQLAFITDFTVENQTGATLLVTPVGTVGKDGHRQPLPLVEWKAPCFPASRLGRFTIGNGESITLNYDWDDINFSELVIESQSGEMRQLVVNPEPTVNQYSVPSQKHFTIKDFDGLDPVVPKVRTAYEAAQTAVRWWLIFVSTAAPVVTFLLLFSCYKRCKGTPAPDEPMGSSRRDKPGSLPHDRILAGSA